MLRSRSCSAALPTVMLALLPPVVIFALGAALLALAYTQPAWLGNRIGPGLFAQWLSKGVMILSAAWGVLVLIRRDPDDAPDRTAETSMADRYGPGIALLASVLSFIVLMPTAGMVIGCAVTAALAGWGAGDRRWRALILSGGIAALIAFAIGSTLLPPTTRLWPWNPYGYG